MIVDSRCVYMDTNNQKTSVIIRKIYLSIYPLSYIIVMQFCLYSRQLLFSNS